MAHETPQSVVYVARMLGQGPVKIGHTQTVRARLSGLQTGSPWPVHILARIHNRGRLAWSLESDLHALLADVRMCGEWFDLGADPIGALRSRAYRGNVPLHFLAPDASNPSPCCPAWLTCPTAEVYSTAL